MSTILLKSDQYTIRVQVCSQGIHAKQIVRISILFFNPIVAIFTAMTALVFCWSCLVVSVESDWSCASYVRDTLVQCFHQLFETISNVRNSWIILDSCIHCITCISFEDKHEIYSTFPFEVFAVYSKFLLTLWQSLFASLGRDIFIDR